MSMKEKKKEGWFGRGGGMKTEKAEVVLLKLRGPRVTFETLRGGTRLIQAMGGQDGWSRRNK